MKTVLNKKWVVAFVAASSLALLTGCGATSGSSAGLPGTATAGGVIGGCVPIGTTNTIGFQATGAYMANPNTYSNNNLPVAAGIIPSGDQDNGAGTYGTMAVVPGNTMVQPTISTGYLGSYTGYRVDGTTITLTATATQPVTTPVYSGTGYGSSNLPYPYNSWPVNGQVNMTGYVQLSSFLQQLLYQTAMGATTGYGMNNPILNTMPGSYPAGYPGGYGTTSTLPQVCVSNLAISLERGSPLDQYANTLYLGEIYIYLSGGVMGTGSMHGLAVNF